MRRVIERGLCCNLAFDFAPVIGRSAVAAADQADRTSQETIRSGGFAVLEIGRRRADPSRDSSDRGMSSRGGHVTEMSSSVPHGDGFHHLGRSHWRPVEADRTA